MTATRSSPQGFRLSTGLAEVGKKALEVSIGSNEITQHPACYRFPASTLS
jgi:hypothetical protein